MPKPTFFRLEKDKQQKVIHAAMDEFSKVPIHEAAVANIIKQANISRGSFYQYFEDKDDLFYYMSDLLRKEPEEYFKELVLTYPDDLFEIFRQFFIYVSEGVLLGEHTKLLRNIFLHMDYKRSNQLFHTMEKQSDNHGHVRFHHHQKKDGLMWLYHHIDTSSLRIDSIEEFKMVFHMIMSTMMSSINEVYRFELSGQEKKLVDIQYQFFKKLNWMQYGIAKTEEEMIHAKND